MDNWKLLTSLGTAVATSKLTQNLASKLTHNLASRLTHNLAAIEADDVLARIGLARSRSHGLSNFALFGIGALAGAGAALLFAPASGRETRARLGEQIDRLAEAATDAVNEASAEAPNLLSRVTGNSTGAQNHSEGQRAQRG